MQVEQALQIAVARVTAGRLAEAEQICRQVLAAQPSHPGALHILGSVAQRAGQTRVAVEIIRQATALAPGAEAFAHLGEVLTADGKPEEAAAFFRKAIQLKPNIPETWNNLGVVLRTQGQLAEAVAAFAKSVDLNPSSAESWFNLGSARFDEGKSALAVESLSRAVQLKPDYAQAHNNLANALLAVGRADDAVAECHRTLQLKPDFAEAYNNLGNIYRNSKQFDQAASAYARAIALNPQLANAHYNLGCVLRDQGRLDQAIAAYARALQLSPGLADAHYAMGMALGEKDRTDEAAVHYARAAALRPNFAMAHNDLGNIYKDQGLLDEAMACYQRASELDPTHAAIHSNRVYVAHFHPGYDPARIFDEHRRWNQRHAEPLKKWIQPHANTPDPGRRVRIGYISPDLSLAPVGRFIEPLLRCTDRAEFEVFCYSDVRAPDVLTRRLQNRADVWRDIVGMPDEQVANHVREDRIDIAVDLTMHMTHHRLLVFARKPAPVQVTYLAYCSTTGLETIDYRFTDSWLEPPALGDQFYSEQSVFLPETYWCYAPGLEAPPIGPLPAQRAGHVTFGCLNNFCKATTGALMAWCRVLREMPNSRFLLHAKPGSHRQRVFNLLRQQGIDPARLRFVSHLSMPDYFRLYNEIDICLDPFPWPGGTTTCDALWMGAPAITLAGQTAVGRAGVSILSNAGLPELIAQTQDEYVRMAVKLGTDLPRLAEIRAGLRQRMQNSPLTDAPRFAKNVGAAYRLMWKKWCEKSAGRQ